MKLNPVASSMNVIMYFFLPLDSGLIGPSKSLCIQASGIFNQKSGDVAGERMALPIEHASQLEKSFIDKLCTPIPFRYSMTAAG